MVRVHEEAMVGSIWDNERDGGKYVDVVSHKLYTIFDSLFAKSHRLTFQWFLIQMEN